MHLSPSSLLGLFLHFYCQTKVHIHVSKESELAYVLWYFNEICLLWTFLIDMDHQVAMKLACCCFASSLLTNLSIVVNVVNVFLGCFSCFTFLLFFRFFLLLFCPLPFYAYYWDIFMKSQHGFENNPLMVFFHWSLQANVAMTTMCQCF